MKPFIEVENEWQLFQQEKIDRTVAQTYIDRHTQKEENDFINTIILNGGYANSLLYIAIGLWQQNNNIDNLMIGMLPQKSKLSEFKKSISHVFSFNSWYEYSDLLVEDVIQPQEWQINGIKHHMTVMTDFSAGLDPIVLADVAFKINLAMLEAPVGKKILIHCKAGRARSAMAAVVALYLYRRYTSQDSRYELEHAFVAIEKGRPQSIIHPNKRKLAEDAVEIIDKFFANKMSMVLKADKDKPKWLTVYNQTIQLPSLKSLLIHRQKSLTEHELEIINKFITLVRDSDDKIFGFPTSQPMIGRFKEELKDITPSSLIKNKTYVQFLTEFKGNIESTSTPENFYKKISHILLQIPDVLKNNQDDQILKMIVDIIGKIIEYRIQNLNSSNGLVFYYLALSPLLSQFKFNDIDAGNNKDTFFTLIDNSLNANKIADLSSYDNINCLSRSYHFFIDINNIINVFADLAKDTPKDYSRFVLAKIYSKTPTNVKNERNKFIEQEINKNRVAIRSTPLFKTVALECMVESIINAADCYKNSDDYGKPGNDENRNIVDSILNPDDKPISPKDQLVKLSLLICNFRLRTLLTCYHGDKSFYRKNLTADVFSQFRVDFSLDATHLEQIKDMIDKTFESHTHDLQIFRGIYAMYDESIYYFKEYLYPKKINPDIRISLILNNIADWLNFFNIKSDPKAFLSESTLTILQEIHHIVIEKYPQLAQSYYPNQEDKFDLNNNDLELKNLSLNKINTYQEQLERNLNKILNSAHAVSSPIADIQTVSPLSTTALNIFAVVVPNPVLGWVATGKSFIDQHLNIAKNMKISAWAINNAQIDAISKIVARLLANIKRNNYSNTLPPIPSKHTYNLTYLKTQFNIKMQEIVTLKKMPAEEQYAITEAMIIADYMEKNIPPHNESSAPYVLLQNKIEMLVQSIDNTYKCSAEDLSLIMSEDKPKRESTDYPKAILNSPAAKEATVSTLDIAEIPKDLDAKSTPSIAPSFLKL